MPQTTGPNNTTEAVVEVSLDGLTWTNISGSTNMVDVPPQTADSGNAATLEGQYKIPRSGKFNPQELTITILYTESATEAFALFYGQRLKPGLPIYERHTPFGNNGEWRYYTGDSSGNKAAARIMELQLPGANASEAAPQLLTMKLQCTQLVRENATPSPSASVSPSASASS